MASMYCWPSVSIKRGARLIVGRKVIKVEFEWTFGYLLISTDSSVLSEQVSRVITSKIVSQHPTLKKGLAKLCRKSLALPEFAQLQSDHSISHLMMSH